MNYELRITHKLFTVLVLVAILFSQAGLVVATGGSVPDSGVCKEDADCVNTCCCCDKAAGTVCVTPEKGVCGISSCQNVLCPFSSHRSLYSLMTTASNYIFYIGLIVAPLMIVIGAFLFLASGGSPEKTMLGKNIIKWALIGLGFILFAKGIASIIGGVLFG